jgi:hypothetical protein
MLDANIDNSCTSTYVTLCIYHKELTAEEITKFLSLEPTRTIPKNAKRIKENGWFLTTEDRIESTVLMDHMKALFEDIRFNKDQIALLIAKGAHARIFCFWVSAMGNGGPVISAEMLRLYGELNLDLHFDLWFENSESIGSNS